MVSLAGYLFFIYHILLLIFGWTGLNEQCRPEQYDHGVQCLSLHHEIFDKKKMGLCKF